MDDKRNMEFFEVVDKRHSVRKYADGPVERAILDKIVEAASKAPSSRNSHSSAFMIIEDKDTLVAMSKMRDSGASPLAGAAAAIIVLGDPSLTDLWIDNCAISATMVHLAATASGLASCWVHISGRQLKKEDPSAGLAEDYITELLGIKENLKPYCAIAIGYPQENA